MTVRGAEERAPAKVNLFLHVTGKRADGYHLLDSLAVFAGVADRLSFVPAETLSLAVTGPFVASLSAEPDNLVLRAARALAEACGVRPSGALTLDKGRTTRAITSLGTILDRPKLDAAVGAAFRLVRRGTLPGFEWLTTLLQVLTTSGAMQFPEELMLFRKALLTMSEVAGDVSGQASVVAVLTKAGAAQFFRELLRRPLSPVGSRDFGTHLSNADLMWTWVALFFIPSRFWIGTWRDVLHLRPRRITNEGR